MAGEIAMERKLAAILAADVVGYSALMEKDEAGTFDRLKTHRKELFEPEIKKHHGRIFKLMGDGLLSEFGSVVDAVECAVAVQRNMAERNAGVEADKRIEVRIGVNLGEVIVEGKDRHGEGVNIAARLQQLAPPGGICISGKVAKEVEKKLAFGFEPMGEQRVKNIAEPIEVFRVKPSKPTADPSAGLLSKDALPPNKPSIAVLPFANMSGDPEQEYFSDGITEDIITDLSKVSALNVMSRNTAFTFQGKAVDIAQIAQRLKVAYVVEGSVRKAGGRVRITAQLIDAGKDSHIWGERYDRDLTDIFALQDEIAQAIVAALKIRLLPAEKTAIESRSTHDPRAYQLYLLGRYYMTQHGVRNVEIAVRFYQRALEIDPSYARAWALVALCQSFLHLTGRSTESGLSAAENALALDRTLAEAHAARGRVLAELGRYDEALAAHEESLRLEPDSFDVRDNFGMTCFYLGRHEAAIEHFERAAQLLETDYRALFFAASCHRLLGRHDEFISAVHRTLERLEKEIALRPDNARAMTFGAIALAYLGEKERVKEWASRALTIEPDDTMHHYNIACAMTQIGDLDYALDQLECYLPKGPPEHLAWIKRDTDLMPLHGHPRYQALIAREKVRLDAALTEQASTGG
jgi:adenylate cyclase